MARDFKKCLACKCKRTVVVRFTWPGGREERACQIHLKIVKALAKTAGFAILLIPLEPFKEN